MPQTILHCINSFSSRGGGVSFALKSLCDELDEFKHIVLALRDDQPALEVKKAKVQLFDRTGPFALSYSLGLEASLLKYMHRNPETVVHVHGLWSGMGWSVNMLKRQLPGIRYIVSPHGMLSPAALQRRWFIKKAMSQFWESSVLSNAIAVHCLTPVEEGHARAFDANLKTFVLPHAIDFPYSNETLAQGWKNQREGKITLLYLGRIHETKGLNRLISAIDDRARKGAPVSFRLRIAGIGEPTAINALKSQISGSPADLEYIGPAFGDSKESLLQDVHGLVLPSMTEGLPMTLMEAAAHGLPLFVTHECNLDWINEERAGFAVPYGEEGIASLINLFDSLTKLELAAMGLRAANAARARYSNSVVAARWGQLYSHATTHQAV